MSGGLGGGARCAVLSARLRPPCCPALPPCACLLARLEGAAVRAAAAEERGDWKQSERAAGEDGGHRAEDERRVELVRVAAEYRARAREREGRTAGRAREGGAVGGGPGARRGRAAMGAAHAHDEAEPDEQEDDGLRQRGQHLEQPLHERARGGRKVWRGVAAHGNAAGERGDDA